MSKNKKNTTKIVTPPPIDKIFTAKELAQKIKSLQKSTHLKFNQQEPTGSLPKSQTKSSFYVEDTGNDISKTETQSNYKKLYEEERINSVVSEFNNKTNQVEAKLTIEVEKLRTFVENKFSSFIKWGIGIVIAIIGMPIGVFYFLLNNHTDKIESNFDYKMEKRIQPIENKIKILETTDSLKIAKK
jgi:hypothetical protein